LLSDAGIHPSDSLLNSHPTFDAVRSRY
jgi:hypothetical protein